MDFDPLAVLSDGYAAIADITADGDAAAGTLTLENNTKGDIKLRYTSGDNFASGSIYYWRSDTNVVTDQAVTDGLNNFTSFPAGIEMAFWVMPYNSAGESGSLSNPIFLRTAGQQIGTEYAIEFRWRTDRHDWQRLHCGDGIERISIPTNVRGNWYQFELRCREQNKRVVLSDMKLHALMHGTGEEAMA